MGFRTKYKRVVSKKNKGSGELKTKREEGKTCRMSRMLALFMAFAVFVSLMVVPQETYAAAKASGTKYSVTVHNINSNTVLRKGTKIKIEYTAYKTKGGVTSGTKVKFKSSKKKVASVSKKGWIKAKKKGTAYITVYCKSKPSKKKKIKIRVGTPVSSISISGTRYLRVGRSNTLKASPNSGATNKNVSWWSDNPSVATVDSNGKVKAIADGECTIYATAKDGSGVFGTRKVYVHQYRSNETKWIAHRGLHTSATENTAGAFEAAGAAGGFWGCECDIWESMHVAPVMPALPGFPEEGSDDPEQDPADGGDQGGEGTDPQQGGEGTDPQPVDPQPVDPQPDEPEIPDVTELKATIAAWPPGTSTQIVYQTVEVKNAWDEYTSITKDLSDEQMRLLHKEMLADPEDLSSEDLLAKLFDAYSWVMEYDSIDFPINHDSTFSEIWGYSGYVRNMSARDIKAILPGVCFLEQYLDICKVYGMVPVIEFKDPNMSPQAVNKALDLVESKGLLDKAYYISFYKDVLYQVNIQTQAKLNNQGSTAKPITYYLSSENDSSKVIYAAQNHFTGVSLSKSIINDDLVALAKNNGLKVGSWTYKDKAEDDELLYKHMFTSGYGLEFVTMDYRIFK